MEHDPTAIPIEFDPMQQRMKGTAIHGNTPFDVPYISHIGGNLYVGGCRDGLQLPRHIKHVVSLYPWERYELHDGADRIEFTMYDGDNDTNDPFFLARDKVLEAIKDGPTLIHCQAGLNRSNIVAALVLMAGGTTASDAIHLLRKRRSPAVLCNRDFEEWLMRQEED